MAKNENMLADSGMKFFGKMTASATHEIKNTLAIINENAGLLEDLSMMAEKGHPLSFERIINISQKVTKQVQRSDLVLKKLNRFSHVDLAVQMADLEKTVYFVLELSTRLIEMQETVVEVTPSSFPVVVDAKRFYLENMIWRGIETACSATKGKSRVMITFGTHPETPEIWFSTNANKKNFMDNLFESKEDKSLIEHLDISIKKNDKDKSFGLLWPKRI